MCPIFNSHFVQYIFILKTSVKPIKLNISSNVNILIKRFLRLSQIQTDELFSILLRDFKNLCNSFVIPINFIIYLL